jgi:3-oxoacyl-[acyl-carrier-protein] synthase III
LSRVGQNMEIEANDALTQLWDPADRDIDTSISGDLILRLNRRLRGDIAQAFADNSRLWVSGRKVVGDNSIGTGLVWTGDYRINDKDDLRVKLGGMTLGDGGAAMVVEQSNGNSGITEVNLLSMGEHWKLCHVPETTDWRQRDDGTVHGWFYLDMPELAKLVRPTTVDYFNQYKDYRRRAFGEDYFMNSIVRLIPHQISTVLIDEMVKATGCDPEKICISANVWGNTASASIPLTLHRAVEQDGLELGSGQDVLLFGAASGYSLGHLRVKL